MGPVRLDARLVKTPLAMRPTETLLIVMVCEDDHEAEQIGRQLSEQNKGCLVTFRKTEDLLTNVPSGKVALIILATNDQPALIARTLKWLRHRWPRCPLTVVGDVGCGENEMAAREGGACYLTRPVVPEQWTAMLSHVLGGPQVVEREKPLDDQRV